MAANLIQLNNYFTNILGIGDAALRGALNNQGLTSFEDFATLTEKDVITTVSHLKISVDN